MTITFNNLPLIIVPDGLAYNKKDKIPLEEPSFVYRAVLDIVKQQFTGRTIYLAPANKFGGNITEQEAAAKYMQGYQGSIITVPSTTNQYIDTRGNAKQLRIFLEEKDLWLSEKKAILVVAELHTKRGLINFLKEGFNIKAVISVPYTIPKYEYIVPRLWYYRYPFCHILYESIAYLRDLLYPSAKINKIYT